MAIHGTSAIPRAAIFSARDCYCRQNSWTKATKATNMLGTLIQIYKLFMFASAGRMTKTEPTTHRTPWSPAGHEEASPHHSVASDYFAGPLAFLIPSSSRFANLFPALIYSAAIFRTHTRIKNDNDITAPRAFEFRTSIFRILKCLARSNFAPFTSLLCRDSSYSISPPPGLAATAATFAYPSN